MAVTQFSQEQKNETIQDFGQALLFLLEQQPLEEISIKELCARAGYSRQAFYRHCADKRDLLNQYYQQFFARSLEKSLKVAHPNNADLARGLVEFFELHEKDFLLASKNHYLDLLFQHYQTSYNRFYGQRSEDPQLLHYWQIFMAAGNFNILTDWLINKKPVSASQITHYLTDIYYVTTKTHKEFN